MVAQCQLIVDCRQHPSNISDRSVENQPGALDQREVRQATGEAENMPDFREFDTCAIFLAPAMQAVDDNHYHCMIC